MKIFVRHIAVVLLAFLVLFSTFSFAIDRHFCGDVLVDSRIFGHAQDCGMEMNNNNEGSGNVLSDSHCCSDVLDFHQGQQELQTLKKVAFDPYVAFLPASPVFSEILPLVLDNSQVTEYASDSSPPGTSLPFYIAFHSLLI